MSLYLLFDIGNTRMKWAAIESTHNPSDRQKKLWAYSGSISSKSLESAEHRAELADYIAKTLPKPDAIAFACVAGDRAITNLKTLFPQWDDLVWQELTGNTTFNEMRTLYQEPKKLGADRWAGLIGARALSSTNTLVVNSGTATTIDLLGANGIHYGGWILPGLDLMQSGLQVNTAQLPLAIRSAEHSGFGLNTNDAIISGCDAAQLGAIEYAAQIAKSINHPIERIYLDGGNAKILHQAIQKGLTPSLGLAECVDGLVLRGLWSWLLQSQKS